jgi:two-component system, OmpR family, response regulator QseB
MNILLVEDDLRLGKLIVHMLEKQSGYKVNWMTGGKEVEDSVLSYHYDIVIVDWMIPEISGVEVCRNLRNSGYTGAIIMVTAKDELQNRVEGLDSGADDYLVKPFEFEELFARIRALSRRSLTPIHEELIYIKNLVIDRTNYTVTHKEKKCRLTPREFQLLDLLVQNKGQILTREIILDRIWGYHANITNNAIDASIKLLRKKIDLPDEKTLILSVRGVGYKFEI